ncbi:hypothetical protein SFR_2552 [Streptomyces sp. FR-008]|nr:hypothetical protein SFR_2552 [Streptomyces sp. FR-008]
MQAAVEAVAGVDGPVATRLALGDGVPLGGGGGGGGAGRDERRGDGDTGDPGERQDAGDLGGTAVLGLVGQHERNLLTDAYEVSCRVRAG